jgi:hypothetical protein
VSRPQDLEQEIRAEVRRLVDRLATLSVERLTAPAPPYASVAAAAHTLAQRFVNVTADLEGNDAVPCLPWVDELVVADQLAVTAQDFRAAWDARRDDAPRVDDRRLTDLLKEVRRVRFAVR